MAERLTNSCKEIPTLCDNAEYWLQVYFKLKDYEDLAEHGKLIELPCKIGDTVYGIRRYQNRIVKSGTVSEMFYNQYGELIIAIKNVCRGCWGKQIFATLEEAEAALKEVGK